MKLETAPPNTRIKTQDHLAWGDLSSLPPSLFYFQQRCSASTSPPSSSKSSSFFEASQLPPSSFAGPARRHFHLPASTEKSPSPATTPGRVRAAIASEWNGRGSNGTSSVDEIRPNEAGRKREVAPQVSCDLNLLELIGVDRTKARLNEERDQVFLKSLAQDWLSRVGVTCFLPYDSLLNLYL